MRDENNLKKKLQHELQEEADEILQIVESDPKLNLCTAPSELRDRIFEELHKPTKTDVLIRLRMSYCRKLKNRKCVVLAIALVLVLAFGTIGVRNIPNLFKGSSWLGGDREQENIESGDVKTIGTANEDLVYTAITETYGFLPVKMNDRPKIDEFQKSAMNDNIQEIQMVFGYADHVSVLYNIHPDFQESFLGSGTEDSLVSESVIPLNETSIYLKKYEVTPDSHRWSAQFHYKNISYFLMLTGLREEEINKILDNLYFA